MSTPTKLVWIRFRVGSSASAGEWEWRFYDVPANINTAQEQKIWLKDSLGLDHIFNDEFDTGSEHYRGVTWEVKEPSKLIIEREISTTATKIKFLQETLSELNEHLKTAQDATYSGTGRCRFFPKCGCIHENKDTLCRKPYANESVNITRFLNKKK